MKRSSLILSLVIFGLAGAGALRAQPAADSASNELDSFNIIERNNIFDASRRGGVPHHEHHVPVVDEIDFHGVVDDWGRPVAFFGDDGTPLKPGDSVKGLKIARITWDSVVLVNATNAFVLNMNGDRVLRREDQGPWRLTDAPETDTASSAPDAPGPATGSDSNHLLNAASPPLPGGNESDIEKRMRLRHEQDDK